MQKENKKQKNMKVIKIKRNVGDREVVGTLTITENNDGVKNYVYNYPYAQSINEMLVNGDHTKISKITGFVPGYVQLVMTGQRWNSLIVATAEKIAEYNREHGFCYTTDTTNAITPQDSTKKKHKRK